MHTFLALLLSTAPAFESSDCNFAVDFGGEPLPVPVPVSSASVRGGWGWGIEDATTGITRVASCVAFRDVPEPYGAARILDISVDLLVQGLGGTVVTRRAFTWNDHPAVTLDLDAVVVGRPVRIRAWLVMVGSRMVQLQVIGPRVDPGAAADAFFGSLRVLRDLGEKPPSQVPVAFAPWTSPDGLVRLEVPGTPKGDVQALPLALPAGPIPLQSMAWYAPGHGTFGVRWARLPASATAGLSPAQLLDVVVQAQTTPMQLEEVRATDVPGAIGRDLSGIMGSMRARGRWPARVHVRLVGDLVVIVLAYDREGELSFADADRVVTSLRIGP